MKILHSCEVIIQGHSKDKEGCVSTPFRFFGYFILFFLQIVWFFLFDVKYYSYQCFFLFFSII